MGWPAVGHVQATLTMLLSESLPARGERPTHARAAQPVERTISERIRLLRYPLIFGITLVHIPPATNQPYLFEMARTFITDGLARGGVPLLTCISGFLLFQSRLDRAYRRLVEKKAVSLVLPLVVTNLSLMLALYLLQANDRWTPLFGNPVYPFDASRWFDAIFGISTFPKNPQLYFLRDLFVVALLAPAYGFCLRRTPVLGLIALIVVFGLDLDSSFVLRNDIPINFYVGGMAAMADWDLRRLDGYAGVLLAGFTVLCAIVAVPEWPPFWFRHVAPWLLWPISSRLLHTRSGRWFARLSEYSFFLFLSHWIIFRLEWRVYIALAGKTSSWYPVFWCLAPIAGAVMAGIAYDLFRRTASALTPVPVGRNREDVPAGT